MKQIDTTAPKRRPYQQISCRGCYSHSLIDIFTNNFFKILWKDVSIEVWLKKDKNSVVLAWIGCALNAPMNISLYASSKWRKEDRLETTNTFWRMAINTRNYEKLKKINLQAIFEIFFPSSSSFFFSFALVVMLLEHFVHLERKDRVLNLYSCL